MEKRTKEFRSLRAAAPAIRQLVELTSKLDNPEILLSVGRFSKNVEDVLSMARDCKCNVNIKAILSEEVRDKVVGVLSDNKNFNILSVHTHKTGHIPNYLVSDAGFYLQNGLEFEDAIVSFERQSLINFLINLYEESLGEAA